MTQLTPPVSDPTSIFEFFRGSYGTELLTAAVAHFDLFGRLATQSRTLAELQADLNLDDGPLPVALYSAALFTFTEGRAYSAGEYNRMLTNAGLQTQPPITTLVHCHAIVGQQA